MKITKKKLIIAITGATGAIYGIRLLEILKKITEIETHLIISKSAMLTIAHETSYSLNMVKKLSCYYHNNQDISASISSGSFKTDGMIIAPCSMKTLGAIAYSIETNLIIRAANVCLKEKRKLILLCREFPLHSGYIENMLTLSNRGAIIAPPVPAFYNKPKTIDDIINHTISRLLDLFDIETNLIKRWDGVRRILSESIY